MLRVAEYFKARVGNFKVTSLLLRNGATDEQAMSLLNTLLRSKFAKNDVLDIQCNIKFQLAGKDREVVLSAASGILEKHIHIIWSHLKKQALRSADAVCATPTKPSKMTFSRNETPSSCCGTAASTVTLATVLSTPSHVTSTMLLSTPNTASSSMVLTTPCTVTIGTELTSPFSLSSTLVSTSAESPVTNELVHVIKKRKGGPIVDLGTRSKQIIYKKIKGTIEDAYTVAPQHMDETLINMLSTKTRNKVKDALRDDSIEFSLAVPDAAYCSNLYQHGNLFRRKWQLRCVSSNCARRDDAKY